MAGATAPSRSEGGIVLALCLVPPLAWLGVGAWALLALAADPTFYDNGSRGELEPFGVALLSLILAQGAALLVGLPATVLALLFAWLPGSLPEPAEEELRPA